MIAQWPRAPKSCSNKKHMTFTLDLFSFLLRLMLGSLSILCLQKILIKMLYKLHSEHRGFGRSAEFLDKWPNLQVVIRACSKSVQNSSLMKDTAQHKDRCRKLHISAIKTHSVINVDHVGNHLLKPLHVLKNACTLIHTCTTMSCTFQA